MGVTQQMAVDKKKVSIEEVSTTELEDRFSSCILSELGGWVGQRILDNLNKGKMIVPTIDLLIYNHPDVKQKLLALYDTIMAGMPEIDSVSEITKLQQAALFDSLIFIYDTEAPAGKKHALYTLNLRLLGKLNNYNIDILKAVMKKNVEGYVKAFRIDIEYINGNNTFSFTAVKALKPIIKAIKDDDKTQKKTVYLLPYIGVKRLMELVETKMLGGSILYIEQDIGGMTKGRCVTYNKRVLKQYCDVPEAIDDVTPKFFPLTGKAYLPVVGAPSYTAMITKIDMLSITGFSVITKSSELKKHGVERQTDPMKSFIGDPLVQNKLLSLKGQVVSGNAKAEETLKDYILKMPSNVSKPTRIEELTPTKISSYLHSLKSVDVDKIYTLLDLDKDIANRAALFGNMRIATDAELQDIEALANNYLCRFICQNKDTSLSVTVGTNNDNILKKIYGDDYKKTFASFASKLSRYHKSIANGLSVEDSLKAAGLKYDQNTIQSINGYAGNIDRVEKVIAEANGVSLTASRHATQLAKDDKDRLMVKGIHGYVSSDGKVEGFYQFLTISKIIKVYIFE